VHDHDLVMQATRLGAAVAVLHQCMSSGREVAELVPASAAAVRGARTPVKCAPVNAASASGLLPRRDEWRRCGSTAQKRPPPCAST
jgi:hypothetical protein